MSDEDNEDWDYRFTPRAREDLRALDAEIGDHRALLLVRRTEHMLEVHHVGHRRNIYDRVL